MRSIGTIDDRAETRASEEDGVDRVYPYHYNTKRTSVEHRATQRMYVLTRRIIPREGCERCIVATRSQCGIGCGYCDMEYETCVCVMSAPKERGGGCAQMKRMWMVSVEISMVYPT
jgi:hypothetical protein